MNRIFKISTSQKLPLFELLESMHELSDYRYTNVTVGHPAYYFYDYTSFLGVRVTGMDDHIEICTGFFSNSGDFLLASIIMNKLAQLTDSMVTNEENEV